MLQKLREQTKNTGFKILVGIIIFVLAIFGFGAFNLFLTTDPEVASVNGEGITQNMLARQADRVRRQLAGQLGEQFDPNRLDPALLHSRALEELISGALFRQAAEDLMLGASAEQISEGVRNNPSFQIAGEFSEAQYRQVIRFLGYSPQEFLDQAEQTFPFKQLSDAITTTGILVDWEVRQSARLLKQQRDLAYLTFASSEFSDQVEIGDEDVLLRYEENQLDYMTEQNADVEYVELSWDDLISEVELTEEEIQSAYELDRDDAVSDEKRRSAHILLQVTEDRSAEQAEELLNDFKDRVTRGASFGELAEEFSEDPGSAVSGGELGSVGKGVFDPEFERVLWSLAEGEISDPIRTEFGYHLIRLDAIEINEYPALEVLRPEIEMRLKQAQSRSLFKDRVRELDNLAFEQSDSLDRIVAEFDVELKQATGILLSSGEGVFDDRTVREAVFSSEVLEEGYNSAAIEYQDQRAVVVRVVDHRESEVIPFIDVAEDIKTQIVAERARVLAADAHTDALARLRAGESVSVVADDYGLEWQTVQLAGRDRRDVSPEIIQVAFKMPRPMEGNKSLSEAVLPGGDRAIVTVTRVQDGDLSTMPDVEIQRVRAQLANRSSRLDFEALFETLRVEASIDR
ncbi:MAG: SurA N-terminal domain-containing protein [Gammaproteobacteria bacterium]|nr:SurA N-terminal domain-containing protein [Gammaproteobacteria bacterium]